MVTVEHELLENIRKARLAVASILLHIPTEEDWAGVHMRPTEQQARELSEAREHLADCINVRIAWLADKI
jgi:hypothetical protein